MDYIKKNDIIPSLTVTSLSGDGTGICKANGMVIFLPFSAIGDIADVRILKVNKNYAFGKIERLIAPSPDRVNPACPVYGKCGGCTLRHISYKAQLKAKEQMVIDAFTRIGGLYPEFLPIIPNENIDRYRNKVQLPFGRDKSGEIIGGFYAPHSHRIVAQEDCLLQPEIFTRIISCAREIIKAQKTEPYNEETRKGNLRHIYLRRGHYSGNIMLCAVAVKPTEDIKALCTKLCAKFPEICSAVININPDDTNVILGDREIVISGDSEIEDIMCENRVRISPKSFYQVNTPAAEKLYNTALDFAEIDGKILLDLYCGAGTITLAAARRAKKAIGVEIIPEAIENARKNAEINGITNAEFICADAGKAAKKLKADGISPDVIIVDPPRKGCGESACKEIAAFGVDKIVMISCNPATAARDCKLFEELGYTTEKVRSVDLFSGTGHVECVVLMAKTQS